MELVKWDSTQNKFIPDETNSSYDYNNQQWANAVVRTKDENNEDIESYFVWIPRYEYKINYNTPGTPSDGGTIDIKFIPTSQTTADEGYIIHPAFTSDVNNGGWNEELPGIWVGKYESSRSDAGTTKDQPGTSEKIAVVPGVTSWRSTKIEDMYTYAREYSENLNSHMLKNSEWGAVAYLTESEYGRNGTEVTINNSTDYITGSAQTSSGTTSDYKSTDGVLASSTGNIYGIYDLSGGAYEYVAAYYTGGNSTYLNYGRSLVNEIEKKYVTAYTRGVNVNSDYKLGDATYETSGWHGDYAYFVTPTYPFFRRSGYRYLSSTGAGVFGFGYSNGNAIDYYSFRMCLAVK